MPGQSDVFIARIGHQAKRSGRTCCAASNRRLARNAAGALKPDVILFGEPLPYEALSGAQHEALACDVMLVAGTSLEVMPAADLPMLAKRRGARLILVNLDPTPLDHAMDVVIRADVAKALSQLARAILS